MKTKFNGILTLLLALVVQISFAQERTISGVVSDETGGLPGVAVLIKGTSKGTETDFDGNYSLKAKSGDTLIFQYLGYETIEKIVGTSNKINVQLKEGGEILDEVVVTGVAKGTSTKKLGFSLDKVGEKLLEEVPALDAASSLRGKVAGINIVQSQGDGSASVTLRGAKSVFGNASPLILIDGIITDQKLGDINTSDIESIEVIKGAAASSLYGSRAAGGVIQILTKKGKKGADNFQVSIRSEVGFNELERKFPQNDKHAYEVNPDGTIKLDASGKAVLDVAHGKFDRDYSTLGLPLYNNFDRAITKSIYNDNTFSVSGGGDKFRFYASAQLQNRGGLLKIVDSDKRKTTRVNFDVYPTEKITIGFRASYSNISESPISDYNVNRGGQNSLWEILMRYEPFVDVLERDETDGTYAVAPRGAYIQGADGAVNPFYKYSQIRQKLDTDRFVGGINLDYKITDDLVFTVAGATDRAFTNRFQYYPIGYKTATPNADLNDGQILFNDLQTQFNSASAQLNYSTEISEDLKANFTAKYLIENQKYNQVRQTGSKLTTADVYNIAISDPTKRSGYSYQDEINSQNYFLNADFDYQDKLIFSGLIRRDGSSLFGANERWQTYFRTSLAYRLTKDVEINGVQELKLRASYGTAGRRPGFRDQYERANVASSGISFRQSGNPNLKPSVNKELETGFDIDFLDRFNLSFTYSNSIIENDFITRPLPSSISLFQEQVENLGAVESNSYELSLGAKVIDNKNFKWDANLTFDKSNSKITDLGPILPFSNPNATLYRIEKDIEVGTMYGNYAFTSLSELEVDANGIVTNAYGVTSGLTVNDFIVNNMGYVVEKNKVGTADERAIFWKDENNNKGVRKIGSTQPNFKLGLANTLSFGKGFKLFFLLDYKNGGDTYNATDQYLVFNDRSAKLVEATNKGHHFLFVKDPSSLYNSNSYANTFVEESSYLKLREVAASYTLHEVGSLFDEVKIGLVGRNLATWTDYSGFNPEGGIEDFSYPLFRTFSTSVTIKF